MPASGPSFLQSPEWQETQEWMGRPTARIRGVLIIRHDLPLGYHYWYAPRPELDTAALHALLEYTRTSGALSLKIDPLGALPAVGFRSVPSHSLQPSATLYIDCRRSDAELLAAMHSKTRYNIGLAERHGVTVRAIEPPVHGNAFGSFWRLLRETAERDGFHPHPVGHYRALFDVRSDAFSNRFLLAEFHGEPVAAAVMNCYRPSGTATYLHGGSNRSRRALMAPYLLHWRIMQYVRASGFAVYDFGGVDEVRWPGVTRFKRGFGGSRYAFPPSVDYVFRRIPYAFYRLRRRLLRAS